MSAPTAAAARTAGPAGGGAAGPRPVAARRSPHTAPDPARSASLSEALRTLAVTAIDRLAGAAATRVDELADSLGDLALDPAKLVAGQLGVGVLGSAVTAGGLAALQGRNPVWAGLKAGVGAMSTGTKVVVGILLILTAVLAPVALLVVALLLLVAAVAGAIAG